MNFVKTFQRSNSTGSVDSGVFRGTGQPVSKDLIKDGWFREKELMWPGQAMTLQVKEVLAHFRTPFQEILVFDSVSYGRCLILDGIIQFTERDEFAYQEMIAHVPLFSHPNPNDVLLIGGGDGGVLREITKHSCVKTITMVEIDELVVATSKKFFPKSMATAFKDPRLCLLFQDGYHYTSSCLQRDKKYDVIIVDSSDPVGPAESLCHKEFYQDMYSLLKPGGVLCTQGENMFLHLEFIREVLAFCRPIFPTVGYCTTSVPTYPNGGIGFVVCSKSNELALNYFDFSSERKMKKYQAMEHLLRYYTPEIHQASFALPKFLKDSIGEFVSLTDLSKKIVENQATSQKSPIAEAPRCKDHKTDTVIR